MDPGHFSAISSRVAGTGTRGTVFSPAKVLKGTSLSFGDSQASNYRALKCSFSSFPALQKSNLCNPSSPHFFPWRKILLDNFVNTLKWDLNVDFIKKLYVIPNRVTENTLPFFDIEKVTEYIKAYHKAHATNGELTEELLGFLTLLSIRVRDDDRETGNNAELRKKIDEQETNDMENFNGVEIWKTPPGSKFIMALSAPFYRSFGDFTMRVSMSEPALFNLHDFMSGGRLKAFSGVEKNGKWAITNVDVVKLTLGVRFALQLARGVAFLHKNELFHKDIKPDNIVIDMNRNVRLIDFGLGIYGMKLYYGDIARTYPKFKKIRFREHFDVVRTLSIAMQMFFGFEDGLYEAMFSSDSRATQLGLKDLGRELLSEAQEYLPAHEEDYLSTSFNNNPPSSRSPLLKVFRKVDINNAVEKLTAIEFVEVLTKWERRLRDLPNRLTERVGGLENEVNVVHKENSRRIVSVVSGFVNSLPGGGTTTTEKGKGSTATVTVDLEQIRKRAQLMLHEVESMANSNGPSTESSKKPRPMSKPVPVIPPSRPTNNNAAGGGVVGDPKKKKKMVMKGGGRRKFFPGRIKVRTFVPPPPAPPFRPPHRLPSPLAGAMNGDLRKRPRGVFEESGGDKKERKVKKRKVKDEWN